MRVLSAQTDDRSCIRSKVLGHPTQNSLAHAYPAYGGNGTPKRLFSASLARFRAPSVITRPSQSLAECISHRNTTRRGSSGSVTSIRSVTKRSASVERIADLMAHPQGGSDTRRRGRLLYISSPNLEILAFSSNDLLWLHCIASTHTQKT